MSHVSRTHRLVNLYMYKHFATPLMISMPNTTANHVISNTDSMHIPSKTLAQLAYLGFF